MIPLERHINGVDLKKSTLANCMSKQDAIANGGEVWK